MSKLGKVTQVMAAVGLITIGAVAVTAAGAPSAPMSCVVGVECRTSARLSSVGKAYAFLDQMMDRYATGSTPRLVQSFTGGLLGRQHFTDSETYDDALMIDAYLAGGTRDDLGRAEVIGNGLLYVQAHDPDHDGRIRAAYAPTPLRRPGDVRATDPTSDVGNMAWVGQALVQLYAATHHARYLHGAEAIGTWIQLHCRDTRGAGGYTGGYGAGGQKLTWKSTEHNIDLYALFTLLAKETHQARWTARAAWARRFVASMWIPSQHRFYVGTGYNGVTPNNQEQPEDVNSWSYLALEDPAYASSIDWDITHLAVTAHGFPGVSFCRGDRSGVWFEGTAHLADALETRHRRGDAARAAAYLADIRHAQADGPNTDGEGIIAASKNYLSDCDGDYYFASLHTGATSWYILAAKKANPFHLLPR
jgi:hypothetical protein